MHMFAVLSIYPAPGCFLPYETDECCILPACPTSSWLWRYVKRRHRCVRVRVRNSQLSDAVVQHLQEFQEVAIIGIVLYEEAGAVHAQLVSQ
jgi:hypothetical protein